ISQRAQIKAGAGNEHLADRWLGICVNLCHLRLNVSAKALNPVAHETHESHENKASDRQIPNSGIEPQISQRAQIKAGAGNEHLAERWLGICVNLRHLRSNLSAKALHPVSHGNT